MVSRIRALVSRIVQGAQGSAERHKLWAAIGIVLALFAVLIYVPKLSFVQPAGNLTLTERAKAESDLRGHLLQALGGLALIVGAYFTGRTFGLKSGGTNLRTLHTRRRAARQQGARYPPRGDLYARANSQRFEDPLRACPGGADGLPARARPLAARQWGTSWLSPGAAGRRAVRA